MERGGEEREGERRDCGGDTQESVVMPESESTEMEVGTRGVEPNMHRTDAELGTSVAVIVRVVDPDEGPRAGEKEEMEGEE
jgi:hypothetical protein